MSLLSLKLDASSFKYCTVHVAVSCSHNTLPHASPESVGECRGILVPHPMEVEGAVAGFSPFHNINCAQVGSLVPQLRTATR